MEGHHLEDSLKEALAGLQHYIDLQVRYNKLLFAKKTGEASAFFIFFLVLLGFVSFALLFLSFAFIEWYYANYGDRFTGRLIAGLFYVLLALIVLIFRKALIVNPVRRNIGNMFSREVDDQGVSVFKSKESLNKSLYKYKKKISKEEKDLKHTFNNLKNDFTLPKIIQNTARVTYQSFMTATNMARLSLNIAKSIKNKFRNSVHKNKKGRARPQIEEKSN